MGFKPAPTHHFMSSIFTTALLQPILNLLIWLYGILPGHDIGFSIIVVTIIVKTLLFPLTQAQLRQQRALQELQPRIEEIRARLKDDKEGQAKELMALYAKEKVNPAASCLPLLVQLPVFIALYRALSIGLQSANFDNLLYAFVAHPQSVNTKFLGLLDLTHPSYVLAVLAALVQFWQTRQMLKRPSATTPPPAEVEGKPASQDEGMAAMMNKQMTYMMPVLTAVIGFSLPGGLALYWLTMSLLTVAQQTWLLKTHPLKGASQAS